MAKAVPGTRTPTKENVITFWQNICKLPRSKNPCVNNNGGLDQSFNDLVDDRDFFYLSSQREGPGNRTVTVPKGKKIFIPILGVVATQFESRDSDVPQLKKLAKRDQDSIKQLSVEFNGKHLTKQDLDDCFVTTDSFDVEFPDYKEAIFQGNCRPQKCKAVAAGRYLIKDPLSKGGKLTIHIKGNILVDPGERCLERGFNEDLTYTLIG
jgi:hypothetical protein